MKSGRLFRNRIVELAVIGLLIGCGSRTDGNAAPPLSSVPATQGTPEDEQPVEPTKPAAVPKTQIVFVLDCSASMGPKKAEGRVDKMNPAKNALAQILNQIAAAPRVFDIGLFAFGHRFRDARASHDVEEIVALGPAAANVATIQGELRKLKPFGYTPLFQSISDASNAIRNYGQPGKRLLIVITDGENFVPGGKPIVAQQLATAAVAAVDANEIQLALVGFDVGGGLRQGPAMMAFASQSPRITFLNAMKIDDVKQRIVDTIGLPTTP